MNMREGVFTAAIKLEPQRGSDRQSIEMKLIIYQFYSGSEG